MDYYFYIDSSGDGTVVNRIAVPDGTAAPARQGLTARSVTEVIYYTTGGAIRIPRAGADLYPVTYTAATDTYSVADFDVRDTRPMVDLQISANSGSTWVQNNGQWYDIPVAEVSPYRVRIRKLNAAGDAVDTGFNGTYRVLAGITASGRERQVQLTFANGVSQAFTIDTSQPREDRIVGSEQFEVTQPLRYRVWTVDTWG